MSFQHLIDYPDEMLFFNYNVMRMSYQNYSDLKALILTHITQSDQTGGLQFQVINYMLLTIMKNLLFYNYTYNNRIKYI